MTKLTRVLVVAALAAGVALSGTGCKKMWPWGKKSTLPTTSTSTDLGLPGGPGGDLGAGGPGSEGAAGGLPARQGQINEKGRMESVVYFAFDSSAVGDSEKAKVEAVAQYMKDNPEYVVVIEGHCDERGTAEYNRGLGERRALAVREYLVSLGVEDGKLETISYGLEKPAVAGATSEEQHAKNRRCEFVIGTR
ncbi:MAG: OmpA family protein [Lentisphaeria bacterium]